MQWCVVARDMAEKRGPLLLPPKKEMLNFATIVTHDFLAANFVNAVVYLILIFFELCGKAKHQPNRPSVCFVAKGLACHACFMHGRA